MADRPEVRTASRPVAVVTVVGLGEGMVNALARVPFTQPWRGPSGLVQNTRANLTRQVIRSFMGYSTGLPIEEFRSMERTLDRLCKVLLPVYDALLDDGRDPATLIVAGDSGGGGLATSLMGELWERHRPRPAALVLFSPEVDLDLDQPSVTDNADRDILPWNIPVTSYLHGVQPNDARVSAGIDTETHEEEGMFHVFPIVMPWAEAAKRVFAAVDDFVSTHLPAREERDPGGAGTSTRAVGR